VRLFQTEVKALNAYPVHNLDTGLNYTTIQEAIDANETLSGHMIFVEQGNYSHVVVNKGITLVGEKAAGTIVDGFSGRSWYTISILVQNTSDVCISGFTFVNGYEGGIEVQNSHNITFSGNLVYHNFWDGIRVLRSSEVKIVQNNIYQNEWGITVFDSNSICIIGNNVSSNWYGVGLHHSQYSNLTGNLIANNRANGVSLFHSRYSAFRNNNLTNNVNEFDIGGYDGYPPNDYEQDIDNSNLINGKPMYYWVSKRNQEIPSDAGCVVLVDCENIAVRNLALTNQTNGIWLICTTYSTIENVTASNNNCGIRFQDCYFYVFWEGHNTIVNSTITNNHIGVVLSNSGNNTFYHNNFIDNDVNVQVSGNPSLWDNGYPSGGNFWSDYNGTDINLDSIGDSPYVIEANNTDHYPLMTPYILPEFPSFLILPLFAITTLLAVTVYRRKARIQNK
jgi:parallel beta-helix repeat protein